MTRWTAAAVLAVILVATHHPVPAAAQTSEAVGVVTTLDGRATVARPALTAPLALKFKDDVFGRDRISTQENSLVRVLLGGKAILTVRELSQVTISEEPGRAVVTLPSGKVVLAVAKQRMRPGESVEIRTPNAVAAVRGSILAVAYDAAQNLTTAICHAGACTYQYAGGATNPLPPGQGAKNGQVAAVTQAERDAAVNVEPSSHAFSEPDEGFQASLFQGQALQAIQVAEFASTGTVSALPGTPNLNPSPYAPVNGLTSHPEISSGNTGGSNPGGSSTGTNVVVNGGFESSSLPPNWSLSGAGGIITSLGSITPPEGTRMALIHTGVGALPVSSGVFPSPPTGVSEGSRLAQSFTVEGGSLFTVRLNYNFVTNEFPSQSVDDIFRVRVTDPSAITTTLATESRLTSSFQSSSEVINTLDFITPSFPGVSAEHGATGFKLLNVQWVPEGSGVATLSFDVFDRGDTIYDSAALIDGVSVAQDPPLYFVRRGDALIRGQTDPLLRLASSTQTFDSLLVVCCGGRASLAGPLLHAADSSLTVPWSLLTVLQGGVLTSSSAAPLVMLEGGSYNFGTSGVPAFDLSGLNVTPDAQTGLILGSDRPLQHAGSLLETSRATVNASQAVRVDTALLEATAPLLSLINASRFTTATDAVQLSYQAKVTSLGSLIRLDRSAMVVASGAAINVGGGSLLRVTGDLFSLTNGSSLQVLNGPLVSLSGGSLLSVNGALIGFGGTGGNLVSVANSLCPCTNIGGLPVSLTNGAAASNVTIAGAIKNGGLGTLNVAPNAAVIRVDGAGTKVTINGM